MKAISIPLAVVLLFPFSVGLVQAQWASQTIALRPGWNAVYLEVQPEPRDCDIALRDMPVESVWRYNRRQTTVQFIDNPTELVPNAPDWLTWLSPAHPLRSRSQLYILEGGRPYLVKVADNAAPFNWTVRGVPRLRKPDWLADSFNFVGFPLPTANPPTLQSYFTNSAELATGRIYRLNTNGIWLVVNNPATNRMQRGEAFWVRSTGLPDYSGPLEVQMDRRSGLDFGSILTEQTFRIRNTSTNATRVVNVRPVPSEAPPIGSPAIAGSVLLSYWRDDFANRIRGWTNFPAVLQSNIPPGGTWELRLEVRRRDMPGLLYRSSLEITDATGITRLLVPVMAQGLENPGNGTFRLAGSAPIHPHAGLWVGAVTIDKVNYVSLNSANPLEPVPTASDLPFRVLVHVDAAGQATFLQKVLQMWKPGQTNDAGEVVVPGRFVLFTDEKRITSGYTGAAVRDGKLVGRRFSSAAFGFSEPIAMSVVGSFGAPGSSIACDVVTSYTNALNPFLHRYHPDHNNFTDRTDAEGKSQPLPVRTNPFGRGYTVEVPTILRQVQLTFTTNVLNNLSGWGDTRLGGTYTETIRGLHASPLMVRGDVFFQRASQTESLNN